MAHKLVIVESPAKARTIEGYLGRATKTGKDNMGQARRRTAKAEKQLGAIRFGADVPWLFVLGNFGLAAAGNMIGGIGLVTLNRFAQARSR